MKKKKTLAIILGPTGIGKTDLTIEIAKQLHTEIISCDSRQFFKELHIGTAVPSPKQLASVKHHLIGNKSIYDYYNSYLFEQDALAVLHNLFKIHDIVLMTGGSGMYIDAICNGIDLIPDIDVTLRDCINKRYVDEGIDSLRAELKVIDPEYYKNVDLKNPKRLIRAIEVYHQTGHPYSFYRKSVNKDRNFNILKVGLSRNREELYDRIDARVDIMIEEGLVDEAKQFHKEKHLNALNTVGYKEIFEYLDCEIDIDRAVSLIKRNTRHYAKKQISWFNRDETISWFNPDEIENVLNFISKYNAEL